MTKRIYLVRHGSTPGNEKNVHQTAETPLSPTGEAQAKSLGERFKNIPADVILASDMKRAMQTATAIADATNLPLIFSPLLVEMSTPSVVHDKAFVEPQARSVMETIFKNFTDKAFRHSDEETFWDLHARAQKIIEMILSRDEEKIIVVTHGLTLKMVFATMLHGKNLTPEFYGLMVHFFRNTNTGITICDYEPGRVPQIAHDYSDWKCVTFNDHAHLG